MSVTHMFAAVLAVGACLMAWLAFTTLGSGADGYLLLVGGLIAAGAIAFLVFAARLFLRKPRTRGKQWSMPEHSPSQRLIFGGLGLFAVGSAAHAVMGGVFPRSKGKDLQASTDPGSFWIMVAVYLIGGSICLYLALRRPRDGR